MGRRLELGGNLRDTINQFRELRVLVIGDAMLDGYLEGYTDRLCREAPVPVVSLTNTKYAPGGAANTAANVARLGAQAALLSVIGTDVDGKRLVRELEAYGVSMDGLLAHPERHTLAKRRILAAAQMLIRFDEGTTEPIDPVSENRLAGLLRREWERCDAVIVSDYGYGILTPGLIRALGDLQAEMPRVLVVDSKRLTAYRQAGVTAVKPNYGEATRLLGIPKIVGACARAEQIADYGEEILSATGAQTAAVTLDREGALVFERDNPPYRTYAEPEPDSHAAGAGDTFVSAFALALAARLDTPRAAEIASAAATVVVNRTGTTVCSVQELLEYFSAEVKYLSDPAELAKELEPIRQQCQRIVFTNGCFDILHRGHIAYLNRAKSLGDVLVVAVNSDESVRRLKGPSRPINSLEDRISVLSALSCVDHIIAFDADTPIELIRQIRPDIYVKGGDYTRETLPEAPVVEELGGRVEILPYIEDRSTTGLIERIRGSFALAE